MRNALKPTIFRSAAVLLTIAALGQTARATPLLNESGTALLAPVVAPPGGFASNPQEYLPVAWTVVENASLVYTYSYTVQNPANDVILTGSGGLSTTPEIVDQFTVDFNTTAPGTFIPGSQMGGSTLLPTAIDLGWTFSPAIQAGASGPTVSFESDNPPTLGNASADDAVPPAPWSSVSPSGTQLPVPVTTPEPSTTALLAVAIGLLALFRFPKRLAFSRI
jgi:hypothetical protein